MLANYVREFRNLRVDLAHGPERVHKPCMLLVTIDLAESGALCKNRVLYDDTVERFQAYARAVRPEQDMKPYLPFFHLRSAHFWKLIARRGSTLPTKAKHGQLKGVSACLDPELYRLLTESSSARARLRYALVDRWFPRGARSRRGLDRGIWRSLGVRAGTANPLTAQPSLVVMSGRARDVLARCANWDMWR